jgi:hypothetical protein
MVLLPIAAVASLWAVRRGARPRRAWAVPLGLAAALTLSAWVSAQTGEAEEERVERTVAAAALESHEAAADRFLLLSAGVMGIMALGMVRGRTGAVARGTGLAAALALTVAGYQVGHSGGALIYQHGAASAYAGTGAAGQRETNGEGGDERSVRKARDHDDDR